MCIYVKNKKPLIADRDIPVRKILKYEKNLFITPFNFEEVTLNSLQVPSSNSNITFHQNSPSEDGYYEVSNGFVFSFSVEGTETNRYLPDRNGDYREFEAYIPKGTEYYFKETEYRYGRRSEYASRALFITDKEAGRYVMKFTAGVWIMSGGYVGCFGFVKNG